MNNDNNIQNENEFDLFDYFEFEDMMLDEEEGLVENPEQNRNENDNINDRIIFQNRRKEIKISSKTSFALIRLFLLSFFYFLSKNPLCPFLINLISFLLIHEALVITNYLGMKIFLIIKRGLNPNTTEFPSICTLVDTLCGFIFFSWFIYGNICVLSDKDGLNDALKENVLMTYYITVLLLFGFFIFAKLIFYAIFFIAFCPCLAYVLFTDLRSDYRNAQRAKKLNEALKPVTFKEYAESEKQISDTCYICIDDFKENDLVIKLPCSSSHVFHEECIKTWIKKKTICPLCRSELLPPEEE